MFCAARFENTPVHPNDLTNPNSAIVEGTEPIASWVTTLRRCPRRYRGPFSSAHTYIRCCACRLSTCDRRNTGVTESIQTAAKILGLFCIIGWRFQKEPSLAGAPPSARRPSYIRVWAFFRTTSMRARPLRWLSFPWIVRPTTGTRPDQTGGRLSNTSLPARCPLRGLR